MRPVRLIACGMMLLAMLASLSHPASAQSGKALDQGLVALRASDTRVLAVGTRLATANAPFCKSTENTPGMTLHHIGQYGDAAAARATFGFARDYAVLALVADAPAAKAGIRADDAIVALNGIALAPTPGDLSVIDQPAAYRPVAWANERLRTALGAGPVTVTLLRGGQQFDAVLTGTPACRSRFELRPSEDYGASADGDIVGITSAMLDFMVDDDELAAILAHEMAHNLLEHRRRLNDAGIQRGLMQQIGRNARLTLSTEIEADRLSIWLMANAGHDPAGAIRFWTRYGKQRGKGIFSAPTHYRWKKRVALFQEEIARLEAMPAGATGRVPPLLAQPLDPLD